VAARWIGVAERLEGIKKQLKNAFLSVAGSVRRLPVVTERQKPCIESKLVCRQSLLPERLSAPTEVSVGMTETLAHIVEDALDIVVLLQPLDQFEDVV
jgi:hypothetical protein